MAQQPTPSTQSGSKAATPVAVILLIAGGAAAYFLTQGKTPIGPVLKQPIFLAVPAVEFVIYLVLIGIWGRGARFRTSIGALLFAILWRAGMALIPTFAKQNVPIGDAFKLTYMIGAAPAGATILLNIVSLFIVRRRFFPKQVAVAPAAFRYAPPTPVGEAPPVAAPVEPAWPEAPAAPEPPAAVAYPEPRAPVEPAEPVEEPAVHVDLDQADLGLDRKQRAQHNPQLLTGPDPAPSDFPCALEVLLDREQCTSGLLGRWRAGQEYGVQVPRLDGSTEQTRCIPSQERVLLALPFRDDLLRAVENANESEKALVLKVEREGVRLVGARCVSGNLEQAARIIEKRLHWCLQDLRQARYE